MIPYKVCNDTIPNIDIKERQGKIGPFGWSHLFLTQAPAYYFFLSSSFHSTSVILPSMISELESIAAIRPRALHSLYGPQTKGILGAITTSACSPASMYGGSSTFWFPVFLPIFHLMRWRQHGALAVRTWTVGVNPPIQESPFLVAALSWPGWSWTNTMAEKVFTHFGLVFSSSD